MQWPCYTFRGCNGLVELFLTILFKIITRIKLLFSSYVRSLQLQFSGPTGINFRYSYSFVGLTGICLYSYSSVQLHKKWSSELFSENYSYSYIKNGFQIKNVMISKRMVLISEEFWSLLLCPSDHSIVSRCSGE